MNAATASPPMAMPSATPPGLQPERACDGERPGSACRRRRSRDYSSEIARFNSARLAPNNWTRSSISLRTRSNISRWARRRPRVKCEPREDSRLSLAVCRGVRALASQEFSPGLVALVIAVATAAGQNEVPEMISAIPTPAHGTGQRETRVAPKEAGTERTTTRRPWVADNPWDHGASDTTPPYDCHTTVVSPDSQQPPSPTGSSSSPTAGS